VEAEARRFAASADRFTVYVVRKRWADAANVVKLTVDGGAQAETVPESFVRLRLPPGEHVLRASWSEGETRTMVRGAAGEIRVVELAGSAWAWGSRYGFMNRATRRAGTVCCGLAWWRTSDDNCDGRPPTKAEWRREPYESVSHSERIASASDP
jgi:hypothetical protein